MKLILRGLHFVAPALVAVALLLGGWGPASPASAAAALPAARADDGQPPDTEMPLGFLDGINPPQPSGCVGGSGISQSNFTHQLIHDYETITSTIHLNATPYTYLWDVKVTTQITHSWSGDLDIHLISPAGTDVVLSQRNGGSFDNVFSVALFEDQAGRENYNGLPITDFVFSDYSAGKFNPQEPLGVLRGENPNGDWKLVVHDGAGGNDGGLYMWSLTVSALKHAPDFGSTFIASQGPATLSDGGRVTETINVPGYVDPISAITVTTAITHARPGDLNIFLISPLGVTLTLSSGNGLTYTNAFAGTTWDDAAGKTNPPGPVTLNTFASNVPESPLAPEEGLSELLGTQAGGPWKIVVVDTPGNGGGTLAKATLGVHTAGCNPNLAAFITAGPGYPRLGQSATLTLTASNSSVTATNVTLTANLDPQLRFQALSGPWNCNHPPVNAAGPTLNCTTPSVGHNASVKLLVTVTAPSLLIAAPVTLTVGLVSGFDTDPANNTRVTPLPLFAHSANNQPWDFQSNDSGGISNGGQGAFSSFGQLRVSIDNVTPIYLTSFGMAPDSDGQHWTTTIPLSLNGLQIERSVWAPANQNWLRYVDTYHNSSNVPHSVVVLWGGYLGSSGATDLAASSSGDLALTKIDEWGVTKYDPLGVDSSTPPVGFLFRSPTDSSYNGPVVYSAANLTTPWPPSGQNSLAHSFFVSVPPGATKRLAFFLYRGLAEGKPGPQDCTYYGGCVTPATGSQVSLAVTTMTSLAANPPLCDLSPAVRASLLNWPGLGACHDDFLPVIRK